MKADFSALDTPEVLMFLFHPRREYGVPHAKFSGSGAGVPGTADVSVPVETDIVVGARFHLKDRRHPNILFFHGNGEIAADYEELAPFFNGIGVNFLVADYRGYGRSSGYPTVSSMMRDSHTIYRFVLDWFVQNRFTGPLILMGRSLGSASAIELAATHADRVCGLVVESGFAYAAPLLRLLGVDPAAIGFREEQTFRHLEKIARFRGPFLVIHAEFDHIIPFSDGQALFKASSSPAKTLLKIPHANHNDILSHGLQDYFAAIQALATACPSPPIS
jgi:hypothetical protein